VKEYFVDLCNKIKIRYNLTDLVNNKLIKFLKIYFFIEGYLDTGSEIYIGKFN